MQGAVAKVDVADVERAIADGFKLLRFGPEIEAQYEADTGAARCRRLIRQN